MIQEKSSEMIENNHLCIDSYTFDNEIKYVLAPVEFAFLSKSVFKKKEEGSEKGNQFQRSLFLRESRLEFSSC